MEVSPQVKSWVVAVGLADVVEVEVEVVGRGVEVL